MWGWLFEPIVTIPLVASTVSCREMLTDLAIKLETFIRKRLAGYGIPDYDVVEQDSEFLKGMLQHYADEHGVEPDVDWMFLDKTYFVPDRQPEDFDRLVDLMLYRPERFDCDDFALMYKSAYALFHGINAIGFVVDWDGTSHAYNIVWTHDGVVLVEPQNGNVVVPGESDMYAFDRVHIAV